MATFLSSCRGNKPSIYRQVGGWIVFIFIFGFLVPGINNWGYGCGMDAGASLGFLLGYQDQTREQLCHAVFASSCRVLTILSLAWAVLTSLLYRFSG